MDFFTSSKAKKDAKRSSSGLFGKKTVSKSNPASPLHPAGCRSPPPSYLSHKREETEYDFPMSDNQRPYWKQPASERVPNSHPRPPVYGYGTQPEHERRREHGRERMDEMSYEPETDAPSSPFHPAGNRMPERPRKSTEYSREHQDGMYEADTRSNASPFHPFRSPSPSPYQTPDRRRDHNRDHYEAVYEPEANTMLQNSAPSSPFNPAGSRSPSPYRTPDRRSNLGKEQIEDMYERDGEVTPRNRSPPSPFHPEAYRTEEEDEQFEAMYEPDGAPPSPVHRAYFSSSDEDEQFTYLYPEIRTPLRSKLVSENSTPVHHDYQMVVAETYEQENQLEPPDESKSFAMKNYGGGKEENQSTISEAYVSVASYRVRQSVSETLEAILEKHGDIAAASKLQSVKTRSYYLESLAAVVMELKGKALRDLTKTRVGEMAAVVKDMESVKIDVSWLKTAVAELGEAVEYLGKYEEAKAEKEVCERDLKEKKGEMDEMKAELEKREKEIRESREKVTAVAGRLGQLEMKGSRLNKNLKLFHSKVHKFNGGQQGEAVLCKH